MRERHTVRYCDVNFDSNFMSAIDGAGRELRFTPAESDLLKQLTARPHTLMSRDRLLDIMIGVGSEASDRFIDFLVNRLRQKLNDTPRKPRFIATRYGEGYIWVADKVAPARPSAGAFIVVGPSTGLDGDAAHEPVAREISERLVEALDTLLVNNRKVVPDDTCPSPQEFGADMPQFQIELCFVPLTDGLHCALTLKHFPTGTVVRVSRMNPQEVEDCETAAQPSVEEQAAAHLDAIWRHLGIADAGSTVPRTPPVTVRLHDAARAVTTQKSVWSETERRLRERIEETPGDAEARLLLASAIHSKYVQHGTDMFTEGDPRVRDEAEIEALVTGVLPELQTNGVHALTAAKLLYFVRSVYRPHAVRMAEDAYRSTPAFAAALALYGQMRMWQGDAAEAVAHFETALGLSDGETTFRHYLLTLLSQALIVLGTPERAAAPIEELCGRAEAARRYFCIRFDTGGLLDLSGDIDSVLSDMTPARARAVLLHSHYVSARLFVDARHRRNQMAYPAALLVDRFGPEIVPEEAAQDVVLA